MSSNTLIENELMELDAERTVDIYTGVIVLTVFVITSALMIMILYKASMKNKKSSTAKYYAGDNDSKTSILDQVNTKDRMLLQSRVANARTARHLFSIFDEFEVLHKLKLPMLTVSADHVDMKDQIFRDIVREKININDMSVKFDEAVYSHPEQFQKLFLERVEREIAHHVSNKKTRQNLALHVCCHLSRTRAGGDSLFAVRDIFDTPQLVITASHTDTHPPTDLHISDDGWASITTTSNFDVYLYDQLHPDENAEEDVCPSPLVTLSVRLEEAFAVSDNMIATQRGRPFSPPEESYERGGGGARSLLTVLSSLSRNEGSMSTMPHPLYRRMSIVCFDPYDPSTFSGGVDRSSVNEQQGSSQVDFMHGPHDMDSGPISADSVDCMYYHRGGGAGPADLQAPAVLSRSKTDPGVCTATEFEPVPIAYPATAAAHSETNIAQMRTMTVGSTGLRKRGLESVSIKAFKDTVDISTGGGVDPLSRSIPQDGQPVDTMACHDQDALGRSYVYDDQYNPSVRHHLADTE